MQFFDLKISLHSAIQEHLDCEMFAVLTVSNSTVALLTIIPSQSRWKTKNSCIACDFKAR